MKVLILSCNTGEGHNSAGKAVKEYIESHGDQAEFIDLMMLSGKKTSKAVGGLYVNLYQGVFREKNCSLGGFRSEKSLAGDWAGKKPEKSVSCLKTA